MRGWLLLGIAVTVGVSPAWGQPASALAPATVPTGSPATAAEPGAPVTPAEPGAPVTAAEPPPATPAIADDGLGGSGTIRGDGPPGYVALTFDDGPNEGTTSSILATLAAHDAPAAFFVVGKRLGAAPRRALLAEIRAAGHVVGNHTWSHKALSTLSAKARDAQLAAADAAITATLGAAPTTVRPPYGATTPRVRAAITGAGRTMVLWNIDPHDWAVRDPKRLRRETVAKILAEGGGIIVLHDTKVATARALPGILADLEAASCARLGRGQPPIIPVSLHYFVKDGDQPRPVPAEVEARTERYRAALIARCAPPKTAIDNHTGTH